MLYAICCCIVQTHIYFIRLNEKNVNTNNVICFRKMLIKFFILCLRNASINVLVFHLLYKPFFFHNFHKMNKMLNRKLF